MGRWLSLEWHKVVILLIGLDTAWDRIRRLWERFAPLELFVERRYHERRNIMGNILKYLEMAKYAIPVIDAVVAEIKAAIPVEKADVVAAYEAVEKAVTDLKAAIENLITAVKTAVQSAG